MTADALEDAVRRVVADLLPDATVVWGDGVDVFADGELVCTAWSDAGTDPREAVAHVAHVVQDAAIERAGEPVPECPGHPHPAVVRVTDDGVAWTCPATGALVAARPVAH